MTGVDLIFQLFALLLGFSVAELLAGMARTWRIKVGATRAGEAQIRIGWLAPLLASLVMIDQTHFKTTIGDALFGHQRLDLPGSAF